MDMVVVVVVVGSIHIMHRKQEKVHTYVNVQRSEIWFVILPSSTPHHKVTKVNDIAYNFGDYYLIFIKHVVTYVGFL